MVTCVPPSREFLNIIFFLIYLLLILEYSIKISSYCLVENTLEGCLAFFQHLTCCGDEESRMGCARWKRGRRCDGTCKICRGQ